MAEEKKPFQFGSINDNDESLKSKALVGQFGLNTNCYVTKFEYNPNAGKEGSPGDAFDIYVNIEGKEFRSRLYDITSAFDENGNQITDRENEIFVKYFEKEMPQRMGVITHVVKAFGVTQQQIDNALKVPAENFVDWGKIMLSLVPADYSKRPVDIFLEYQWSIKSGNNMTYLQLPTNMKGGRWICPHVNCVGEWKEQREWVSTDENGVEKSLKGLRYVDTSGAIHPFTKDETFMESPKANQQKEGQDGNNSAQNALSSAMAAKQGAVKDTWG